MNAILPQTEVDFYANKKLNEHGKQLLSILNLTTLNKQQVDMICSLRIKDTTRYDDATKFKLEGKKQGGGYLDIEKFGKKITSKNI